MNIDALLNSFSLEPCVGPFLLVGIVLLAGAVCGRLAQLVKLPAVTGNIFGGILIGPSCLGVLDVAPEASCMQPLSTFAMGLIAVSIGGHLSYRRIHNALRRITVIAVMETAGSVALVVLVCRLLNVSWPTSLFLAAISAETAPGTTIALIRENRGKGPFVKTLVSVVAIDNIICIFLFAVVRATISDYYQSEGGALHINQALVRAVIQLVASMMLGLAIGRVSEILVKRQRFQGFSTILVAILFCTGISSYLGLSPLMTSLFLGVYLGNSSLVAEEQLGVLEPLEPLLYTGFFTLAGASLHLDSLGTAGVLCVGYFLARLAGKGLGACLGGLLSRSSSRIWQNIPFALSPHAGLAIGLLVLVKGDAHIPESVSQSLGAVILAAVTINEIIGPFMTRFALGRAKEVNRDRPRLMEFINEEFIVTDMQALDKWDAIRQLVAFLYRTHKVEHMTQGELYRTIVAREKDMSTAIGHGVAIPHGRISKGPAIQGVLGIFRHGVDFDSMDGDPVTLVMLVVTPKEHEDRHLQVMAGLSAMVSDEVVRTRLNAAMNAHDAWEVVEGEETRNYNYFLE